MVNSFVNDFSRVATFQITNSVGQPKMRWLGIDEGHHELSHEPNENKDAHEMLTKINTWYCEQLAYLVRRLSETPEPGSDGSLLDNTLILWGNELGQGNSHTLDNIPFVMVGNGLDFNMGRSLKYKHVPHNRLLVALAHGFSVITLNHLEIRTFVKTEFSRGLHSEFNPSLSVAPVGSTATLAQKIIIDADPGIGDALARTAMADSSLEVLGLTAVAGMVSGIQATRNLHFLIGIADPLRHPRVGQSDVAVCSADQTPLGMPHPQALNGRFGLGESRSTCAGSAQST